MPSRRIHLAAGAGPQAKDVRGAFDSVRAEFELLGDFPAAVLDEAAAAPDLGGLPDATDLELVTLDPPGATDLDQAMSVVREGEGYRLWYAIADVPSAVHPGGSVDAEAHRRGETVYLPGGLVPLHPPAMSQGWASLLPGQDRAALVWEFAIDVTGEASEATVRRARVSSRAQLDYPAMQQALEAGAAPEVMVLLCEVGRLRQALERARGGVSLQTPDEEVVPGDEGAPWRLELRRPLPLEDWNAQLSLLTGMAAAQLMLDAGVGVLRTMPPPDGERIDRLRRSARTLGLAWPDEMPYAEFLRGLAAADGAAGSDPPESGAVAAILTQAASLFRGAGYEVFEGTAPDPVPVHAAIGGPYAHVTAPLRRLVDRYGLAVCVAVCAGEPVPDWVHIGLAALSEQMATADARAHGVERAVVDTVEALLLAGREGEMFDAVVVDAKDKTGTLQLRQPPVRARCDGSGLVLGQPVRARLSVADVATRSVRFVVA